MVSVLALEELIKENEAKIALQKRQLEEHEKGINKLSRMALASAEHNLEVSDELVVKYKAMLDELLQEDPEELAEREKLQVIAERKRYFDAQDSRIKLNREQDNDKKLEALRIISELPNEIEFEDSELFEIAQKSIELALPELNELSQKLDSIKQEFGTLLLKAQDRELQEFGTIDFLIPIIVLHWNILLSNIHENIDEKNQKAQESYEHLLHEQEEKNKIKGTEDNNEEIPKPKEISFSGFPKYHDWWIRELWLSHQSYFALYKWKDIISNLCITTEQKKAWSIIFDRWVFIKKLLNDKGQLAYNYNFAFDSLLATHANVHEEIEEKNILSVQRIIKKITVKEDFTKNFAYHDINTPYLKFKRDKLVLKTDNEESE